MSNKISSNTLLPLVLRLTWYCRERSSNESKDRGPATTQAPASAWPAPVTRRNTGERSRRKVLKLAGTPRKVSRTYKLSEWRLPPRRVDRYVPSLKTEADYFIEFNWSRCTSADRTIRSQWHRLETSNRGWELSSRITANYRRRCRNRCKKSFSHN